MTAADKTLTPRTDEAEYAWLECKGDSKDACGFARYLEREFAAKTREAARFHHPDCEHKHLLIANCCQNNDVALNAMQWMRRAEEAERELAEAKADCDRLTGMKFSDRMHAALVSRAENAEAEAERLREALNWLERNLIEGKWDGTIGRPKSWHMVGPYRHALAKMVGDTLLDAIDAARAKGGEREG